MKLKNSNSKIVAVILAGGVGSRFGANIPKQYVKVNEKTIVEYTIEKFEHLVDDIVIVCDPSYFDMFKNYHVVNSGKERCDSLNNAMKYVKRVFGENCYVLSHDSARPLIQECDIKNVLTNLQENKITTLAKKATSTFWSQQNDDIVNRDFLYEILTPQAIKLNTYFNQNKLDETCSDLCSYGKLNNIDVDFVFTNENNIKITHPHDIHYFTYYLGENNG